jgi:uncharacterized protein (DUF433 family)
VRKEDVVSRDPKVMNGALVFSGTRVPVEILIQHLAAGDSLEDFLEGFPSVSREQAVAYLDMTPEAVDALVARSGHDVWDPISILGFLTPRCVPKCAACSTSDLLGRRHFPRLTVRTTDLGVTFGSAEKDAAGCCAQLDTLVSRPLGGHAPTQAPPRRGPPYSYPYLAYHAQPHAA